MNDNGNTLKYRVEQLEKQVEKADAKLDLLMTNHIPHLTQEIISMKTRINVLSVVNIGAIVLAIIVSKILP